jgi:hypothetical protein
VATWVGAILKTGGHADFAAIAARYRIAVTGPVTPWVLVQADLKFAGLRPPVFAEALSREIEGAVIAFAVQTTASVEEIEHWEKGQLARKLEYSGDQGRWITQAGKPQDWEPAYFFAEGEGTAEGASWPYNLGDELTDEQLARYERARAAKDASGIMDLLDGGSTIGMQRLCAHFGTDPRQPAARYRPPTSRKLQLTVVAAVAFTVGMVLLTVLGHR